MQAKNLWKLLFTAATDIVTWLIVITAGGAFLLMRGIRERSAVAYVALGGVLFAVIFLLGITATLVIQAVDARRAERNARIEQERFTANAKENLAIMAGMQRVQNAQNTMLQKQLHETQRMLPAPDGEVVEALVEYDDAIFDELEV